MTHKEALLFEADFRLKFLPLNKKLIAAEKKMLALVHESISGAKLSKAYWTKAITEVNMLYAEMDVMFNTWASKNIPARYKRSLALLGRRIRNTEYITNIACNRI